MIYKPYKNEVPIGKGIVDCISDHCCPVKIEPLVEVHPEQTESVRVSV